MSPSSFVLYNQQRIASVCLFFSDYIVVLLRYRKIYNAMLNWSDRQLEIYKLLTFVFVFLLLLSTER
jgi:hypothetical protein